MLNCGLVFIKSIVGWIAADGNFQYLAYERDEWTRHRSQAYDGLSFLRVSPQILLSPTPHYVLQLCENMVVSTAPCAGMELARVLFDQLMITLSTQIKPRTLRMNSGFLQITESFDPYLFLYSVARM